MAKVNFKRIEDSNLIDDYPIEDGSFWVTGDGKTYVDYDDQRIPIAGTPDTQMSDISRNTVENNVIKDYVDTEINSIKTEIKPILLWENPNPNNNMGTLQIDLADSNYDMYEVIYYNWKQQKYYSSSKAVKGQDIALYTMISSNNSVYMATRIITYVSETKLNIGENIVLITNSTFVPTQSNAEWTIPVFIIGYKTGLFE